MHTFTVQNTNGNCHFACAQPCDGPCTTTLGCLMHLLLQPRKAKSIFLEFILKANLAVKLMWYTLTKADLTKQPVEWVTRCSCWRLWDKQPTFTRFSAAGSRQAAHTALGSRSETCIPAVRHKSGIQNTPRAPVLFRGVKWVSEMQ